MNIIIFFTNTFLQEIPVKTLPLTVNIKIQIFSLQEIKLNMEINKLSIYIMYEYKSIFLSIYQSINM